MKLRLSFAAITATAALLLAGCSVMFIAPYDETTDRLLNDLSVKTETAIASADAGQLSASEREKFFDESLGTVRTMKARASLFAKNDEEIKALAALEQRYLDLKQHGASPRTSLSTGLRLTLLDLQQIEIAKKRSSAFMSGLKKKNSG